MKRAAVFLAPALFAAGAMAGTPWFDAGISGYSAWPERGETMSVAGAGVWSGTWYTELREGAGGKSIAFETAADDLAFGLADSRGATPAEPLAVSVSASITYFDRIPEVDESAKGGIVIVAEGYRPENARYFGLVRQGDSNVWARLDGAMPPEEGASVEFLVEFSVSDGGATNVRYSVGGVALTLGNGEQGSSFAKATEDKTGNGEWNEIVCDAATVTSVNFSGRGEVASLSGARESDVASVSVSVPEVANASIASVSYAGVTVTPDGEGRYAIPAGSLVCVQYSPALGYVLSNANVVFRAEDAAGVSAPRSVDAKTVLSITEIMPSNEATLTTVNGGVGFDWIEIRNTADFDIDLTGWYLSDNPDAKKGVGKWQKIQGCGIVPAHGYKIVWAEKEYANWDRTEAYIATGLSASGDPLFLAHPLVNKVGDRSLLTWCVENYGKAIKDVSIGCADGADGLVYFREPTPGAPNGITWLNPPTDEVAFSVPHGYKDEPFDLVLSCPMDTAATIYYTTNGTSPNASSAVYTDPIRIERTTVVRAATLRPDTILQQDTSATYLFLDDILAQSATPPPGFPEDNAVNGQRMEYAMRQATVEADRERILDGFTNSISTVSIVIDLGCLFDAETGIYVNARGDGREWERLAVVEMFSPTNAPDDVSGSFPAGLRIRGGSSRNGNHPKHAFRLFFRSEYGMNKLKAALFGKKDALGNSNADEFDKLDLRCSQNFSWANEGNSAETFIHEVFSRDSQRDLGQPYNRSRYYHLFLNGTYWGLYQSEERVDDTYAESYGGGNSEDYDVIRTSHDSNLSYRTGAAEGDERGWRRLWQVATHEGFVGANEGNYRMLVGEGLLNPTNLMAYMLVSHYIADTDCPVAGSWDTPSPNNVQAFWNREGTGDLKGFVFNKHDAEWSMVTSYREFRTNSYDTVLLGSEAGKGGSVFLRYDHFNPAVLHYRLMQNPEYKAAFMDYARRELTTGALSDAASIARFKARMAEIDSAISCEAARWGRGKTHDTWLNACSNCIGFIEGRGAALLKLYEKHEMMPIGAADALTNAVVKSVMAENDAYGDWLWEDIAANAEERAKVAEFAGTGEALKSCLLVGMPIDENPEVELSITEFGFNPDGSIGIGGAISVGGIEQSRPVRGRIRIYSADTVQGLGESVDAVDAGREFPLVGFAIEPESGKKSKFFQLRLEP